MINISKFSMKLAQRSDHCSTWMLDKPCNRQFRSNSHRCQKDTPYTSLDPAASWHMFLAGISQEAVSNLRNRSLWDKWYIGSIRSKSHTIRLDTPCKFVLRIPSSSMCLVDMTLVHQRIYNIYNRSLSRIRFLEFLMSTFSGRNSSSLWGIFDICLNQPRWRSSLSDNEDNLLPYNFDQAPGHKHMTCM